MPQHQELQVSLKLQEAAMDQGHPHEAEVVCH